MLAMLCTSQYGWASLFHSSSLLCGALLLVFRWLSFYWDRAGITGGGSFSLSLLECQCSTSSYHFIHFGTWMISLGEQLDKSLPPLHQPPNLEQMGTLWLKETLLNKPRIVKQLWPIRQNHQFMIDVMNSATVDVNNVGKSNLKPNLYAPTTTKCWLIFWWRVNNRRPSSFYRADKYRDAEETREYADWRELNARGLSDILFLT